VLFNSFIFWGFFAIVLALYRVLPHRGQNWLLLVASYIFYGYWDWRFLSLILFSTLTDYVLGAQISRAEDERRRRILMICSVIINLGFLGFFKYFGFFVTEINAALAAIGLTSALPVLKIVLPVGISFYTFQSLSYTVDIYRRHTEPARTFQDFALYVSFFPQLVAGPIERSSSLLPQVTTPRTVDRAGIAEGLYLILFGLLKKVVIADNMAVIVNDVFSRPTDTLTGVEVLVGVYAFAFQIYGDFSGYSNVAQGLARMMGFQLRWNFRMPYFATSPSDFWNRWHISLSTWLRDYLYVPLGGNRNGAVNTYRNLALTMLLGGLWHGAAWTFVVWGAFHGAILIVYRRWPTLSGAPPTLQPSGRSIASERAATWFRMLLMFHLVCFSWLLFRAEDMGQVGTMMRAVAGDFSPTPFSVFALTMLAFFALPLLAYEAWLERHDNQLVILSRSLWLQALVMFYCIFMLLVFPPLQRQAFIYFQF
jgi:D-alanyl-lipoteichoic acid acyltransferase DltB (MBOAT superfamily)